MESRIKIIYRISDKGYSKIKPSYINNENCLKNCVSIFGNQNFYVVADNCSQDTLNMINKYIYYDNIEKVSIGHGGGTFNLALDKALTYDDNDIVYFIENDYIHLSGSNDILREGFDLGASFVTLYLHPDKFISGNRGGNIEVQDDGGYLTKIYRGKSELFHIINSTTMTFASKVCTLKQNESILREYTKETYPRDFDMFIELRKNKIYLICPLNTKSTHGESLWLAPLPGVKADDLEEKWGKYISNY